MNFYKRFVGDIQAKTGHLSCAEMGVYDRLLDHYYGTEQSLPGDIDSVCRIARAMTKVERRAVDTVLAQFFVLDARQYTQRRAEKEIAEAQPKIAAARTNGLKGGRPAGTHKKPNGLFAETQDEPKSKARQSQSSSSLRSEEQPAVSDLVAAGFDEATAADFIAHKAKAKAPLTRRAWQDHLAEAKKAGWTPMAAAVKVMAKSWKGFEAKYVASESPLNGSETTWQRSQRERAEEMSGGLVSKKPPAEKAQLMEVIQHGPFAIGHR